MASTSPVLGAGLLVQMDNKELVINGDSNGSGAGPGVVAVANGKVQFGAAGANGFVVEKNGFTSPPQINGKSPIAVNGLGLNYDMKASNGNANGGSNGGGDVKMDEEEGNAVVSVTNGAVDEVITLMDECMDIDADDSVTAPPLPPMQRMSPRKGNYLTSKQEIDNVEKLTLPVPVASSSQMEYIPTNVETDIKQEIMSAEVNVPPPPPVQKCANGKLVECTLDATAAVPCKRCHRVFYCGTEHRDLHSKEHEPDCKTVSTLEVIFYDEQYSMWLKYAAPNFYDTCLNFVLVWPSLTVQWLPQVTELDNNMLRHSILLGTMTNQEQNHLLVCGIDVMDRSKTDGSVQANHAAKYSGSMHVLRRINHEGEVNRARYMPQNPDIVATKSSSPEVFIIDISKGPDLPENSDFSPLLRLRGHQKEGFGLSWSEKEAGKLLSGSNDGVVCLWDINKNVSGKSNSQAYVDAVRIFKAHEDVVEDVDWSPEHKHIFASVGDDKRLIVWDTRAGPGAAGEIALQRKDAHEGDINVVSLSPFSEFCLATGSSDSTVAVWDIRNINQRLHSLEYHRGEVMQVQWSPHCGTTLASTGKDNRVFVWDLRKISKDDGNGSEEYDEDPAPKELAFIHGGHLANVNDISWNQHDLGMIASVTEDNILQVWKISEELQASYRSDSDSESHGGSASDTMEDLE